jgi:hypothetical protein
LRIYRTNKAWPSLNSLIENTKKRSMKNCIKRHNMPGLFFVGLSIFVGLGMSSCDNDDDKPIVQNYAEHTIKGTVQNQSGVAIPSIRVIVKSNHTGWKNDTLKTDDKGSFTKKYKITGSVDVAYNVLFSDIDGATNGTYKADSIKVSFVKADLKSSNGTFLGSAEKEANIKLTSVK